MSWCRIPFYIAAPTTTVDPSLPDGTLIPIEERSSTELTHHQGQRVAAPGINVRLRRSILQFHNPVLSSNLAQSSIWKL